MIWVPALISPQGRGTGGAQSSSLGHSRQYPVWLEEKKDLKQELSGLGRGQFPDVLCIPTESLQSSLAPKSAPNGS